MIYSATVTSQGQITIPADIRRQFDFDKNKKILIEVEKDKIVLKPEPDILALRGIFKTKKRIPFKKAREAFGDYLARRHLSAAT